MIAANFDSADVDSPCRSPACLVDVLAIPAFAQHFSSSPFTKYGMNPYKAQPD